MTTVAVVAAGVAGGVVAAGGAVAAIAAFALHGGGPFHAASGAPAPCDDEAML